MSAQPKGRPGGVLPISAAATKRNNASHKSAQRSPAPRLRLIIRRLPPGLTETEFWDALGVEWKTGNGKVDWHAFKEGKISKDPSKPSTPGRAYIKVKEQALLDSLSAKVKTTTFKDIKNTNNDPCLVGPPSLEFAPYSKIPSGRNRHDGRQGTIDQDQEFIDFLQSLTEPISKPILNGSDSNEAKQEKVITTPLVQFIKEKKANKAREKEAAAAAKSSKKNQETKEGKTKSEPRPTVVVKSNTPAADKVKIAKATQEAVKAANKSVAKIQNKTDSGKSETKSTKEVPAPTVPTTATSIPATPPRAERQRGNASAASRLIARDLGLAPKEPRTPRAAKNVSTTTSAPAPTESTTKNEPQPKAATPAPVVPAKPAPTPVTPAAPPPTGPRNNRSNQTQQPKSTQQTPQRTTKPPPQPTPGAKSAFLKHANPSQGVTEELLRTTFTTFGEVTRCEIDKKKGLGYVDFTNTEALQKAMAASPIKIGNGQVVVLENRGPHHKRQGQASAAAQQKQSGAGASTPRAPSTSSSAVVSAVTSPQPAPAIMAKPEPITTTAAIPAETIPSITTSTEPIKSTTSQAPTPATPTTPTAPKNVRGGGTQARGGRGGSGFSGARGASGGNSHRGRGGFRGRGNRGARGGGDTTTSTATPASNATPSSAPASANQGTASEASKPAPADKP